VAFSQLPINSATQPDFIRWPVFRQEVADESSFVLVVGGDGGERAVDGG
jgi:hypothetical protein